MSIKTYDRDYDIPRGFGPMPDPPDYTNQISNQDSSWPLSRVHNTVPRVQHLSLFDIESNTLDLSRLGKCRGSVASVYLVCTEPYNGHCKVGKTRMSIKARANQLNSEMREENYLYPTASFRCCCDFHAKSLEDEIHHMLSPTVQYRMQDWFVLSVEQMRELASLMFDLHMIDWNSSLHPDPEWFVSVLRMMHLSPLAREIR